MPGVILSRIASVWLNNSMAATPRKGNRSKSIPARIAKGARIAAIGLIVVEAKNRKRPVAT
jgi:hypothetical protein